MSTQDDLRLIEAAIADLEGDEPGSLPDTRAALARVVARLGKLEAVAEAARQVARVDNMLDETGDDAPTDEWDQAYKHLHAALAGLEEENDT